MTSTLDGPILSVSDVVALEKRIEASGTPLRELMNRAGRFVAEWIRSCVNESKPVLILCGTGNNGGDGWVIADYLSRWGYTVTLAATIPADELKTEPAASAARDAASKKYSPLSLIVHPSEEELAALIESAGLVVDAILGTGFNGISIKEPYASWIRLVNTHKQAHPDLVIVSVDVPSGLCAESGTAAKPSILADTTITMLAYKPGLLKEGNGKYCGDIVLARIESADG